MTIPVYRGVARQQGHGLGSILKSGARLALPFLGTAARQLVNTGTAIASDVLNNKRSAKDAFLYHGKQGLKSAGKDMFKGLMSSVMSNPSSKTSRNVPKRRSSRLAIKRKAPGPSLQSLLGPRKSKVARPGKAKRNVGTRPKDIFD